MTDVSTPIDRYLAEQQDSTAVERFSRRHDADLIGIDALEAGVYADRLPLRAPGIGEQYAFRVDLDRCTGCKACVAGCHSLNGLDEGESWRAVGQLVGVGPGGARTQAVPTGCHHCVDPACLAGCPTNAYEKDPFTGIVRHLDDQCFGCGYCELTCPYEIPKLNTRLGVVRKCDMCADRLADGEAPACVQACPTSAITIDVIDVDRAVSDAAHSTLVPGAPASAITVPTTTYVSTAPIDESMIAADRHALHPSASHPPLVAMLVLTQTAIGAFAAALMTGRSTLLAAVVGVAGLAGAFLHLGRPAVAWRAVLGIGHSWFSREVVALGGFGALSVVHGIASATDLGSPAVRSVVGAAALLAGVGGIVCSGLLYVVTRRTWWRARFTFVKFIGTALAAGPVFAVAGEPADDAATRVLLVVSLVALAVGLAVEVAVLRWSRYEPGTDLARTRTLLVGPLATSTQWRLALGLAGAFALVVALGSLDRAAVVCAALFVVAGQSFERYQFFVASVAPRMPGGFRR